MNRIFPQYKDFLPLPDYGAGAFMVAECYEIDTVKNWLRIKGTLYEINQDTGEPEKQGLHKVDAPFNIQSIIESDDEK